MVAFHNFPTPHYTATLRIEFTNLYSTLTTLHYTPLHSGYTSIGRSFSWPLWSVGNIVGGVTCQCTLPAAHCTLHNMYCTLYTAHGTLYTADFTLQTTCASRWTSSGYNCPLLLPVSSKAEEKMSSCLFCFRTGQLYGTQAWLGQTDCYSERLSLL